MNGNRWRTSLRARAAVIGITAIGIAAYGLFGGGKSAVLPFQGKNVSTVATDHYSASITNDEANGNAQVVTIGPSNSLYFYWQINGTWFGPLQVSAPGTVFSGPSSDSGNGDNVAFEGPNHTLYFVWSIGNTWYGPLQIGPAGSTYSAPTVVDDSGTPGNVNVAAQGPSGSLYDYWSINGVWHGPYQVAGAGTTFSAPNASADDTPNCAGGKQCLGIAAKGSNGQSIVYWSRGGQWLAPSTSGTNQEFSSPSAASSTTYWTTAYVGPGNSLIGQFSGSEGGTNQYCVIGGVGTAYSAPSGVGIHISAGTHSGDHNYVVQGPSGSLYAFWVLGSGPSTPTSCGSFSDYGPLQLNGAGTTFSVPALDAIANSSGDVISNVVVEGPSHTLWDYYSSAGTWYGPLQIAGPGTTFDSSN